VVQEFVVKYQLCLGLAAMIGLGLLAAMSGHRAVRPVHDVDQARGTTVSLGALGPPSQQNLVPEPSITGLFGMVFFGASLAVGALAWAVGQDRKFLPRALEEAGESTLFGASTAIDPDL
jgi:hypothetical protein